MLKAGEKAINFTLPDKDGHMISLSDFIGTTVVLYFYPRDNTPGCTVEACSFRDVYDDLLALGVVVIGISPDGSESHVKFALKHNLPFYLLSDTDHAVTESYGVYGEKNMYGKKMMGIIRSTFIIDKNGVVSKAYGKVTPKEHGAQILHDLKSEQS